MAKKFKFQQPFGNPAQGIAEHIKEYHCSTWGMFRARVLVSDGDKNHFYHSHGTFAKVSFNGIEQDVCKKVTTVAKGRQWCNETLERILQGHVIEEPLDG